MKKLVVRVQPFSKMQYIYIYDSEQKTVPSVTTDIENLTFALSELAKEKEIQRIDLVGPKKYSEGIKTQIEDIQKTLYQKNDLIINLI
jgi:hypothetical protein